MPAIRPALLKKQVTNLVYKYDQPAVFIKELHSLLDMYTDHTQQHGQSGIPNPLLDSYNTPPPVMRLVWRELIRIMKIHPAEILLLCDALWAEPNYDMKLLAAQLLGQLPIMPESPILDRLQSWVSSNPDRRLLDKILEHSLQHYQEEAPAQLLELISAWLTSTDVSTQHAGLRALLPLIHSPGTVSMPQVFRMITPFVRMAHPRLRPDIIAVISALAQFSPAETSYLLRQNLSTPDNPDTPWLIRQVMDELPEESQAGLREAMKSRQTT